MVYGVKGGYGEVSNFYLKPRGVKGLGFRVFDFGALGAQR